jgi:hypothetical protein
MAVSGERDADDAGIPACERFVVDTEALDAARAVVVEHDVARADEVGEHVARAGGLEIDRQAALVAVHLVVDALAVPRALAGIGVRVDPGAKHRTRQLAPSPARQVSLRAKSAGSRHTGAARGGMLDLDHFRPEVGEKAAGERPGPGDRELEHANAVEKSPVAGIGADSRGRRIRAAALARGLAENVVRVLARAGSLAKWGARPRHAKRSLR